MNLHAAYLGLTLIILLILFFIGFRAINGVFGNTPKARRKKILLVLFLVLWQVYIFLLGQTKLLQTFELPPRFVIFLIVPAFLFTGIFIYKNRNNEWLDHIPKKWLIFLQSFRIAVETLFVFSVAQGILHPNVTIEGYNYDMIFGFTALLVGFLSLKGIISEQGIIVWNYAGLFVLASVIFVFFTTTYFPGFYGSASNLMPLEFTNYPYTLVAGFLMPVAVFVHVLSLVQLNKS